MLLATALVPFLFVQLVIVVVVLGIVWFFLKDFIAEPFRTIATVIVVLGFCLWLLRLAGIV